MKLLTIDPSSTRTGYALFDGPAKLLDAGYFKPIRATDSPLDRIFTMADDLAAMLERHDPERILIETTNGKMHGNRRGGGAGMAIYGMAVGAMFATARIMTSDVEAILESDWTRRIPKDRRQAKIRVCFPQYAKLYHEDPGADVADAIGIGLYWFELKARRALGRSP